MSRRSTSPDFDPVARIYRWAEYLALGPYLQRTRFAHLDKLDDATHALLFGDGDGRFVARLLARNQMLHATAVDNSAAMLRLLRRRCEQSSPVPAGRLVTQQISALEAVIPPQTDLVVTHFFLDCLSQPEVDLLVEKVTSALQSGALWLVSDFAVPDNAFRGAARLYIRGLYLAFRVLTGLRVRSLPDPRRTLARCSFQLLHRKQFLFGMLYSEIWTFAPARNSNMSLGRNPSPSSHIHSDMPPEPPTRDRPDRNHFQGDAQPDPEPAPPSLPEPDPGVFHHEPDAPAAPEPRR